MLASKLPVEIENFIDANKHLGNTARRIGTNYTKAFDFASKRRHSYPKVER
jgi:hypothetical protein